MTALIGRCKALSLEAIGGGEEALATAAVAKSSHDVRGAG